MLICRKTILLLAFACCSTLFAQNVLNPVLPGVADAGVMKYNGKYYIGGVHTNGDFYVSDDLVHWGRPVHVLSMGNEWTKGTGAGNDQIHANDIRYLNGDFHLYWSVNYWGKDKHVVHIAHAQSKEPLGPYVEPNKKTWMDNRIDPMVFKDDDGQLYMYMVRFTDGNTIWGRKMKNPAEFDGEPVCQFASLPDTWETMDNRVAEGPWVMKYRGRYYMMYNANHTSTEWGNYQLGVAEADSPLGFQNGSKYSHPVVGCNQA
ncbi:family 43 glycosylhydrolase, partial [Bacteroides heparinolyticus]